MAINSLESPTPVELGTECAPDRHASMVKAMQGSYGIFNDDDEDSDSDDEVKTKASLRPHKVTPEELQARKAQLAEAYRKRADTRASLSRRAETGAVAPIPAEEKQAASEEAPKKVVPGAAPKPKAGRTSISAEDRWALKARLTDLARRDYQQVLNIEKGNVAALEGLASLTSIAP